MNTLNFKQYHNRFILFVVLNLTVFISFAVSSVELQTKKTYTRKHLEKKKLIQKMSPMNLQFINDEKMWKKFDDFVAQIRKSKKIRKLDALDDRVDEWNIALESTYVEETKLISAISFVLRDEIGRVENRLHRPRGKSRRPDSLRNLNMHSERLEEEKKLLKAIQLENHKTRFIWIKIIESFEFSIALVAEGVERVEKEFAKGVLISSVTSEQLIDILKEHKKLLNESQNILQKLPTI